MIPFEGPQVALAADFEPGSRGSNPDPKICGCKSKVEELKRHPRQQARPLPTNRTEAALCEAHVQVGFFPNFSTFRASTFDHD
jgi:hypothetical protein